MEAGHREGRRAWHEGEGHGVLRLTAFIGNPDGSHWIRDELEGDPADPAALGHAVAGRLASAGAGARLDVR